MISMPSFSACLTVGDLVGDHLWQSTLFAVAVGFLTLLSKQSCGGTQQTVVRGVSEFLFRSLR